MAANETMDSYQDFSRYQDIFGQLRLLKSYSHFLIAFKIPDNVPTESALQTLESSVLKVTSSFPWLTGKVVNEGSGPGDSGLFKIHHCPQWEPPNSILRVKDTCDVLPSLQQIVDARGHFNMFEPDVVAPCVGFPQSYQESEENPAPVLALQANLVKGGLLFDVAAQHNIIPGGGMLQFLALLSRVMAGQQITSFEIEQGNRDRRNMVRLLEPGEQSVDMSRFRRATLLDKDVPAVPAPDGQWCSFRFSAAAMAAIKSSASDAKDFVSPVTFVSSNDALTAFFWKRLSAIRVSRLAADSPQRDVMCKFVRAVDVRAVMGVPTEYMGHMVYNTFTWLKLSEIDSFSLSRLASTMRKNLMDDVNELAVRSFVTLLANTPDKTTIMYGGEMNHDTDVAFSSIAQSDIFNVSFGVLGKPLLLTRPKFIPRATTGLMWPKNLNGEISFSVCLKDNDLADLKADPLWNEHADLVDKD